MDGWKKAAIFGGIFVIIFFAGLKIWENQTDSNCIFDFECVTPGLIDYACAPGTVVKDVSKCLSVSGSTNRCNYIECVPRSCEKIQKNLERDGCYFILAREMRNLSICDMSSSNGSKELCIYNVRNDLSKFNRT